jgi:N4-gp56 family major capsid protein
MLQTARRWFALDRHDVRSTLPAAIQAIMQNGLLDRVFRDALIPEFLYPALADSEPWQGSLGDTKTFTRKGLIAPTTTAITGSDISGASTYSIEQWSVTMDQYGISVDTNMLQSAMTLASKFLADTQTLGINAGQSLNRIARDKMYRAYMGGRTWCTAAASTDTVIAVQEVAGFTRVLVNGVPTAVSGTNPLNVTINGVANTVTATSVQSGPGNLTLGTTRVDVVGDPVIAANAPVSVRPGAAGGVATAYQLTAATDVATLALFRNAVIRLRKMNVPTIGGYYTAHIPPDTEGELFADADFKQALQGRVDSPQWGSLSIGRFSGIDWVRNIEAPTVLGTASQAVTVFRPIVVGAGSVVAAPFEGTGSLLAGTGVEDVPMVRMIEAAPTTQVALIVRPPADRLQQVISTSWSYVGDFGIPSDSGTGDAALFKRAVVVEHV